MDAGSIRFAVVMLALAALAACARNEVILPLAEADGRVAQVRTIQIATLRATSPQALAVYSGERADNLSFGEVSVSIPRNRKPGSIVYPRQVPNLAEQFAGVRRVTGRDEDTFVATLNAQLANRAPRDRAVMVFVHGYNTNFASGVFRMAQMVHDFGFEGVPVHFSWASAGRTPLYLYDRDSAQIARNGLADTLRAVARSKARGIILLGHSMGGLVTMEALRDLGMRGERKLLGRLEAVVLASPDIDRRVFEAQLAEVRPLPQPFAIFVSRRDRALLASQGLRGGEARVGEGKDITWLRERGITVIDLSDVADGDDATNHSTFATSQTVMAMVRSGALRPVDRQDGNRLPADPALAAVGKGVGALSDAAASIVYLPARIVGVR